MSNTNLQFPVLFSGKQIDFAAAKPIVARAVEQLVSGRDGGAIAEMFNSIDTAEQNYATTDYVFHCVEESIKQAIEDGETDKSEESLRSLLYTFKAIARWYYKLRIRNDIKNKPLEDVLAELERVSQEMRLYLSSYFLEAVEVVRTEVETQIERQRKRARIKQELKILNPPERSTDECDSAKHGLAAESTSGNNFDGTCPECGHGEKYPNRNSEVVTLLLDDILGSCGIEPKSGTLTTEKYAWAIGFITGYSANTTKRIINNPYAKEEKSSNAYEKDNDVRRDVLRRLGLHEQAKKVQ